MARPKGIYVVYARWCPHCVPTTVDPIVKAGQKAGVPVHLYDIDTADEAKADNLVKRYGDWTPDYVIPQVFVELESGEIRHVLTGHREGLAFTRKAVEDLLRGEFFDGAGPAPAG